jgi:hypothetical protein
MHRTTHPSRLPSQREQTRTRRTRMNRFDSLVGLALAGVIALGSSAVQAAPAKSGANAAPQKSSQSAARTPVQRLPGQKPPPWYYPPGPSSHEGSGGRK